MSKRIQQLIRSKFGSHIIDSWCHKRNTTIAGIIQARFQANTFFCNDENTYILIDKFIII